MSSFVYGVVNAKRVAAPKGRSQTTAAPAMKTYIDTLAALVPAEALALYEGVILPNSTSTISVRGKRATVISDPHLLEWSCAGLLLLSATLYFAGRFRKNARLTRWDAVKVLIPPAALTAWMLVQNPGVFDLWWPGSSTGVHLVIAAFTAVVLGVLASSLGHQADQAPALPIVNGLNPKTGPVGTKVTLTGSGFAGATSVSFGQVAGTNPVVVGDTQLDAASPAGKGRVHVTVTTPEGTSATSQAGQFTYT